MTLTTAASANGAHLIGTKDTTVVRFKRMRMLLAIAAVVAAAPPDVTQLVLKAAQVGTGYVEIRRTDGSGLKQVTLDLCGRFGYPSEGRRTARLQVDYLKSRAKIGLSNEVVTYRPGGAAQAMREVIAHAASCPKGVIATGDPNVPKAQFTITRIHDSKLLKGALAVKVRVRATVGGKKFDQTSYAVYQRAGNVLSGTYSFGVNTPAQLSFALHAAEQSARNLLRKHNTGSPTA
jgi:hypothetical protein